MKVMVIVKASKESEAGVMPSTELLAAMGNYNEELVKAGIMLAGEGLHPSSKGKRVKFTGKQPKVTDGPFTETKELIAGFWIWKVKSMAEAVEWLKRCPMEWAPRWKSARSSRLRISAKPSRRNCGLRRNVSGRKLRNWQRNNKTRPAIQVAGPHS